MNKIATPIVPDETSHRAAPVMSYAFVLMCGYNPLDLAAAVAPLAAANRISKQTLYDFRIFSCDGQPVNCSNGSHRPVDGALRDIPSNARTFILAFDDPWAQTDKALLSWLRHRERHANSFLGCIGTSVVPIIEAGILRGRPFTVHWSINGAFQERYQDLRPEPSIYTEYPGFVTCAGGQSASDLMLSLIRQDIDDRTAIKVADYLLGQVPRPSKTPQRLSAAARYNTRDPMFLSVIQAIDDNRVEDLNVDALSEKFGISRRQIERTFNRITGQPPTQFIKRKKLEKARELLIQTDMSVVEVAVATGFGSPTYFSQSFQRQYGIRPSQVLSELHDSNQI